MIRRSRSHGKRGTTLVEVLVAVALMLLVFLFLTAELIQSSQAENVASDHTQTVSVANYLLGITREDPSLFDHFASGPGGNDLCGTAWAPYTDTITAPTWHPMCTSNFPELQGTGMQFNYMWNAQLQGSPPDIYTATVTVWVMTSEGGRSDIYELKSTRMQTAAQSTNNGVTPPPTDTPSPQSAPPSTPPASVSPTPRPSPTKTATPSPTPTPSPTGIPE